MESGRRPRRLRDSREGNEVPKTTVTTGAPGRVHHGGEERVYAREERVGAAAGASSLPVSSYHSRDSQSRVTARRRIP